MLAAVSALRWHPGRHGAADGPPGVVATERIFGGAASLAARNAGVAPLAAVLGWDLPVLPRWIEAEGHLVLWTGPGRWLVFSDRHIEGELRARVGGAASVADQSDNRVVLTLAGPAVRVALAKGVSIDLHPRAFAVGAVAATLAAHIPVLLWREESGFALAVARGFAGSLAEWLLESAAEYGVQVA